MYMQYKAEVDLPYNEFEENFLKFLQEEPTYPDAFINADELKLLVEEDTNHAEKLSHLSYPTSPIYKRICRNFYNWCLTGRCECAELPKYYMLEEGDYVEERRNKFASLSSTVRGMPTLWRHWAQAEKVYAIRSVVLRLGGRRGLLDLLTMRRTTGTQAELPPSRARLLAAFEQTWSDKSSLSVGARALTKHFHRDEGASFWGKATGTEADKNRQAKEVVLRILNNAGWINIHQLPGQLPIMEVRHVDSYGARWDPSGSTFRGFLEPMQPEGWLNKYRH